MLKSANYAVFFDDVRQDFLLSSRKNRCNYATSRAWAHRTHTLNLYIFQTMTPVKTEGFTLQVRARLQNIAAKKKEMFVIRPVRSSNIGKEELADMASRDSGLRREQIIAVIGSFEKQVTQLICNGHHVQMGLLGNLGFTINAYATESEATAGAQQVYRRNLRYIPSRQLREAWSSVTLTMSDVIAPEEPEP